MRNGPMPLELCALRLAELSSTSSQQISWDHSVCLMPSQQWAGAPALPSSLSLLSWLATLDTYFGMSSWVSTPTNTPSGASATWASAYMDPGCAICSTSCRLYNCFSMSVSLLFPMAKLYHKPSSSSCASPFAAWSGLLRVSSSGKSVRCRNSDGLRTLPFGSTWSACSSRWAVLLTPLRTTRARLSLLELRLVMALVSSQTPRVFSLQL